MRVLLSLHLETVEYLIIPRIGIRWRWPFLWVDVIVTEVEAIPPSDVEEMRRGH